ncbi:hypothetical protein [Amycolatopsis decaplanina]|uniref:Uncharacterized protein n=1 Tax=Amycolatopsis decaplanina DSM 44594 TaxID=1284240 RepID=M2YW52_9PSEU|nr:hypothetical protein [Amycolatopsis decaplanina]EME52943.1 hypothetical protein H074_31522 [Amycolatopsis decaplanina DSM 44594]
MTAIPRPAPGGRVLVAVIGTCAVGGMLLSVAATMSTASWFAIDDPFLRPMVVIVLPIVIHGMLALTIVDSGHRSRRPSALAVAFLFWAYLVAGTLWAASLHSPGNNAVWLISVLQNSTGPLLLHAWRGSAGGRSSESCRELRRHVWD